MLKKATKLVLIYLSVLMPNINSVHEKNVKVKQKTNYLPSGKVEKLERKIEKVENELKNLKEELDSLKTPEKTTAISKKGKVFYDLGSGLGKVAMHAYLYDTKNPEAAKKFIDEEYKDVRAEISDEERNLVSRDKMGSPVYGEIKVESVEKLFKSLEDLGVNNFRKSVGIELSPTRYHHALSISNKLKENGLDIPGKELKYINENIVDSNISDADVIFMCSTCYPDELMEKLVNKFAKLKDGLIVISLKSLPNYQEHGFTLVKELTLPMTWSEGSPVNIYKLNKSNKTKK